MTGNTNKSGAAMSSFQPRAFVRKHKEAFIGVVFSSAALYLRFRCLAGRDLWCDEIFQIDSMKGPFKHFWQRLSYGDLTCFPGDYLLTYPFLRMFNLHRPDTFREVLNLYKWGLAVPHILVTILGFYLFYLLCKRYCKTLWGYTVAFSIICFNQNLIFHAFEFRPYAVLPTLALASFYFSEMVICRYDTVSTIKKFLMGAWFIFVICFHAFGILIVGCCLLFYLLNELSRRSFKNIWGNHSKFLSAVLIIALPVWIWYATGNPLGASKGILQAYGTFTFIPDPSVHPLGFLKAIFGNLMGQKDLYFLLAGLILGFIVPHRERFKQIIFFLVMVLLPLTALFLNSLITGYAFLQRYFVWVMPFFGLLLGWQWDSVIHYLANRRSARPAK